MVRTLVEVLADFATDLDFDSIPTDVVDDCKRVLLDSIGCALGGLEVPKGTAAVQVGRMIGGPDGEATILGTPYRTSAFGAAFANGETINALDFDSVLPPGHVAPYVLPGAIAVGEVSRSTGRRLLEAVAVSHEISYRFGKSMDYLRTPKDGVMQLPSVLGFTSTVFGATVAVAMLNGYDHHVTADALGIAAAVSPVNSYRTWMDNVPNSTIKYTMAGPITQAALIAAFSAGAGHTGDRRILDDDEFGYRKFIGSDRWEPENLTRDLGQSWGFPREHSYKPYPHCRVTHTPLDTLISLLDEHDIAAPEIDAIRCWGEGWVEQPVWLNNDVQDPHEAQFSIAHGLAVGAQRIPVGAAWQSPETLRSPAVLDLMKKVTFAPHPDYVANLTRDPAKRPTRVEIEARGETFTAERSFPKGSVTSDPSTYMTTDELVAKFRLNANGVITETQIDEVIDGILHLEEIDDIRPVMRATAPEQG